MIELREGQFVIDGEPQVVMCGEVHYFRVPRAEWEQRLDLVVETGCRAVASYLPWLFHELPDGRIDVTGQTRPERDIAAFIDLCRDRDLWFVARPGPFVMAELKNEGLPYRLYRDHPELRTVGWDGQVTPTATVDYLAPAFLEQTRRWYAAVMPVLAQRLQPEGGNVILVQLDNEVGMLSWVANSPDLSAGALVEFGRFVTERHGGCGPYPCDPDDPGWTAVVRSPAEGYAGTLRQDLGLFLRGRYARYLQTLRTMAEEHGVTGIPFAVNVHGTEAGNGGPFPIGISQLVDAFAGVPGMLAGSDHYLGEATIGCLADLYVMNAFLAAVQDGDQPLTSLEFEAGAGDYGGGGEVLYDPTGVELKTRWSVAQGNRLINYYLLAGGINPPLDEPVGDGDDRIAHTGERHAASAPIDPFGTRGFTFAATHRSIAAITANQPWLARMREDHDAVQLGLSLDAYLTAERYPGSAVMADVVADLTAHRGAGPRRALSLGLLGSGFRYTGVHLEARAPRPDAVLVAAVGRHLDGAVQRRIVRHVGDGGAAVLLGPLPQHGLDGGPDRTLAEALGVAAGPLLRDDGRHRYLTVQAHGWASPLPQLRVGWLQHLTATRGDLVLTDGDGTPCGLDIPLGDGHVVLLAAELPGHPDLFTRALRRFGVRAGLQVDTTWPGVFATTTSTADGQRLVHLINVSGAAAEVRCALDGRAVNEGEALVLPPRSGHMLPVDLNVGPARIRWANAEIRGVGPSSVSFGPGLGPLVDVIVAGACVVRPDPAYRVSATADGHLRVTATGPDAGLTVHFTD